MAAAAAQSRRRSCRHESTTAQTGNPLRAKRVYSYEYQLQNVSEKLAQKIAFDVRLSMRAPPAAPSTVFPLRNRQPYMGAQVSRLSEQEKVDILARECRENPAQYERLVAAARAQAARGPAAGGGAAAAPAPAAKARAKPGSGVRSGGVSLARTNSGSLGTDAARRVTAQRQPQPGVGAGAKAAGGQPAALVKSTLDHHNSLRAKHGAQPLKWSDECAASAQKQADACQRSRKLFHGFCEGPSGGHGQNAYWHSASAKPEQAIQSWYDEVNKPGYDFKRHGFAKGTGHFTQVVWVDTRCVGMAVSKDAARSASRQLPPQPDE